MGCPFPFSFRVFVACCVALAPRSRCCFSLTCCLVTQSLATPLSSIFFFRSLGVIRTVATAIAYLLCQRHFVSVVLILHLGCGSFSCLPRSVSLQRASPHKR